MILLRLQSRGVRFDLMKEGELLQFLGEYPRMSICPSRTDDILIRGHFDYSACPKNGAEITDSYELSILVPSKFPHAFPKVREIGHKIPRDGNNHINTDDTLCLGSPIRIMMKLSANPTLSGYIDTCLVPYLYAISHRLAYGGDLVFSELDHGKAGIIDDYIDLFGINSPEQVLVVLNILSNNENKYINKPCPCGCGKKLKKCFFRYEINQFRKIASRAWFKEHKKNLNSGM